MKKLLPAISFAGLALIIVPACLYLAGFVDKPEMKTMMLIGTVLWFVAAPLWIGKSERSA